MDSRDLLRGTDRFTLVFDGDSFSSLNESQTSTLRKLVCYKHHPDFNFVCLSRGDDNNQEIIHQIESMSVVHEDKSDKISIKCPHFNGKYIRTGPFDLDRFTTREENVRCSVAEDALTNIGIFNNICNRIDKNETVIFVTYDSAILGNRGTIEASLTRTEELLNLMTAEETAEVIGLFLRNKEDFVYYHQPDQRSSLRIDLSLWCDYLVPGFLYYETDSVHVSAITDRLRSLFISIDRVGEQYYSGAHNNSDVLTKYHFNNGIALLTGITDALALTIRDEYQIALCDRRTNLRTGGHPLLQKIRSENEELYNYIHRNHHAIEMLHIIRNQIIHKQGVIPRGPGHSIRNQGKSDWDSQFIGLQNLGDEKKNKFLKYYEQLDHDIDNYDPVTKWGILNQKTENIKLDEYAAIEPYRFLKKSVSWMMNFVGDCLHLLSGEDRPNQVENTGILKENKLCHGSRADRLQRRNVDIVCQHDLFPLLIRS